MNDKEDLADWLDRLIKRASERLIDDVIETIRDHFSYPIPNIEVLLKRDIQRSQDKRYGKAISRFLPGRMTGWRSLEHEIFG